MITALAGGVGAARFLRGLVQVVDPADVTVVVNTGDDDWFHGLYVCPDLDSVTYTLAGAQNPDTGWGLAGETFATVDALGRYGEDTWFRLGDRDLATHLFRTRRLREGATLSEVTAEITAAWGLGPRLLPMTDDRIAHPHHRGRRRRAGDAGVVRARAVRAARRSACASTAPTPRSPAPGVIDAILAADTVLVCPSNPVISIGPILAVAGVRDALRRAPRPRGRREPDHRGPAGEGPGRPADGPARHRRLVRGRGPRVPRVLQHARDRRRRRGAGRRDRGARRPCRHRRHLDDRRRVVAAALARDTLAAVA